LKHQAPALQQIILLPLCEALECQPRDSIVLVDEQKEAKREGKSKN
jgi:DNA-binding Xre family transcriptional regulator